MDVLANVRLEQEIRARTAILVETHSTVLAFHLAVAIRALLYVTGDVVHRISSCLRLDFDPIFGEVNVIERHLKARFVALPNVLHPCCVLSL